MLECLDLNTKIPLLDGRSLKLSEIIEEYKEGKELWAYSCCPTTGKFSPGKISWAGVTRKNTKVVKITFDNGKTMIVTPDHNFPVWKKGKIEAKDLKPNDSIIAFNTREEIIGNSGKSTKYQQVFDHETNNWEFVHSIVSEECDIGKFIYDEKNGDGTFKVVHHKDYNRLNNSPNNLIKMNRKDHYCYHASTVKQRWENDQYKNNIITKMKKYWTEDNKIKLSNKKNDKFSIGICNTLIRFMRENNVFELKDVVKDINSFHNQFICEYRKLHENNNNFNLIKNNVQQKYVLTLVKRCGFGSYSEFRKFVNPIGERLGDKSRTRVYSHETLKELIDLVNETKLNTILDIVDYVNTKDNDCKLMKSFKESNISCSKKIDKLSRKHLTALVKYCGFKDFREFIKNKDLHNHRVVSVEELSETMDTGTITIDQNHEIHDYHTFATDAGVYTYNSYWFSKPQNSSGTEVSTLAGGQNLGQLDDLLYFQKKLYTALKVPYSRRDATAGIIQNNDDITPEELRFAQFVMRVQSRFSKGIKDAFKTHLELRGMWTEFGMKERHYNVEFTPPTNYELRQKHKLIQAKVDTYMLLSDRPEISQEMAQREFLGWSQEKIDENNKQRETEKLRNALVDYKVSKMSQNGTLDDEEPPPPEEPPPDETESPVEEPSAEEPAPEGTQSPAEELPPEETQSPPEEPQSASGTEPKETPA